MRWRKRINALRMLQNLAECSSFESLFTCSRLTLFRLIAGFRWRIPGTVSHGDGGPPESELLLGNPRKCALELDRLRLGME